MNESQYIDITPDMMLKYYRNTTYENNSQSSKNNKLNVLKKIEIDIDTYYCILFCVFIFPIIIFLISIIMTFLTK